MEATLWLTRRGLHKLTQERNQLYEQLNSTIDSLRDSSTIGQEGFSFTVSERQKIQERLEQLERVLKKAKAKDDAPKDSRVYLGSTVYLQHGTDKREIVLVESIEADPLNGYVSVLSPLGKSILGKHKNDLVSVETPLGVKDYQIIRVE